jgi:signal transduction histidine kinase
VCAEVNGPEIKQVVLNLLTNALDSLAPNDESGKVIVSLSDRESEVELTVADNGCGMTEEVRDNLFKPFFTRRQNGQGTGLGLSITHRIVDEHRGIIQPHSDGPGSGSTMTVRIPRKAMETAHEDYERKAA